ncbi:unnamed protein product [Adineta steineri]|nr:unnamed protein product [Adineta steineri]
MKYHRDMTRCIFRIFKTTKADEDEYTCQIDDERGIKTTEPPWCFETKLPATLEGNENAKIELECSVQDENAECDWYFESEKILPELYSDRYEIISYAKVRKMIIKKLSPTEDKERYECKTDVMSTPWDVSMKRMIIICFLIEGFQDIDPLEEKDVPLEVTLSKSDPRGKWVKDGKVLCLDQKTVILNEGNGYELKLKSIGLKDAREIAFQCSDLKDSCKIFVKESEKPPRIDVTRFVKFVTIKGGRPPDLEILYDANPAPEISCEIVNPLGHDTCEAVFHVKTPPKLTREPEEQRVSLGETLKVKIPISGKANDDRVRIQEFDDFIVVTIPDTERGDAGKYAINVANNSRSYNVPLKVRVIAPPLPPTDPLEISDVSKDRATLSRKPPKDDSGSKVTGYVVKRRDTSKGADAWIPVTQACKETTFTVPSLLDGHEYDFRVMAINENGTSEPLRSSAPTTAKLPFKSSDSPEQPDITEMTNNIVTLNWQKLTSVGGGPITGYWIERREGNTDKWIPVNMSPCQATHFTVPSVVGDHIYGFRVTAKNEAGKATRSDATTPTKVKDPNGSTSAPELLKKLIDAEGNEGKIIILEYEVIETPKPDVEWFKGTKEISKGAKYTITRDGDKSTPRFRLPRKYQDVLNYDKGEAIVIKIPYIGIPLLKVTLSKDGNDITKDKNVSIDVSDRAITLTI